uniref:Vomeronasal type 1 receptor 3 n=4 Tax=Pseudocrenilabrinae TaxID=318546 RepID=I7H146_HAPBU|nr:vomeronasal type 1 receptor 3 [Haplochromis burtoni]BAM35769.1 vomeronasal type 1 receptor 3 [Tropheus duboisi]BAM35771.1 vomeronasal type 1 receptor 3 [Petrochromis fasciolatus]BAM35773.1 vomeronasal type 1 receptor 3 [Petrochromis macrognathus]
MSSLSDQRKDLAGMRMHIFVSPAQTAFYIILVIMGILGNTTVILVIGKSIILEHNWGRNSDIIIVNMAMSNLLVSLLRNTLLIISEFGLQIYTAKGFCQLLMGMSVWLRSVNAWSTLFLSAFHLQTLKRVAPGATNGPRGAPKTLLMCLGLIWIGNLIYSIPAHIFSSNGNKNTTETLMLVSSTTRPLLGCVWNFPSTIGLAYATTSLVIHEMIPIILMAITNLTSLYTLYTHGRNPQKDAPVLKRVPAEKRAAKVILTLILLFILSWGTSVISVNYFNYNRGSSADYLMVIARFANIIFIALSPVILAVGHRQLRSCIRSTLVH